MLTECPECNLQVSDKAVTCPHCGYPLKERPYSSLRPSIKKKPRLPNGFGQITKISNKNLRKPYRAMVTVGKTELGKPICKLLKPESYFETYNDAYKALIEYNKNPYDFGKDMNINELHELWIKSIPFTRLTEHTKNVYESIYNKHCLGLKNIMLSEFRIKDIRECVSDKTPSIQKFIRNIFLRMFDYAVQYEYIEKNIIRDFKLEEGLNVKKNHIIFTKEEISVLWDRSYVAFVDWILIQCYTGMRPQELCQIKVADVDLENRVMYGGMKTKAGKNRVIPIHERIVDLVKKNKENANKCGCEYLLCYKNKNVTYDVYYSCFQKIVKLLELNPDHRPHDPRKQFVTMAKEYNVDEYAIKRIVGHRIADITENIYTERDVKWLISEVNKIV